jgi:histidinol-phosphate phosphatase family protein
LRELLATGGVFLAGVHWCPHHPQAGCDCRKPQPGMLTRAAAEHGIDLGQSWMVGDILDDVEAGHRAGCRTVLLDVGHETEWVPGPLRSPDVTAGSLVQAAEAMT